MITRDEFEYMANFGVFNFSSEMFKKKEKPNYGPRIDGTPKGVGFFGPLHKGSEVVTEYATTVNIDGKETLIPTVVPTLSKGELDSVVNEATGGKRDNKMWKSVIDKSVEHAKMRIKQGRSPFLEDGEKTTPIPKQ